MIALNVLLKGLNQIKESSYVLWSGIIVAFVTTFLLIPIIIHIACKYHILDQPDGAIKTHGRPVPYLGGFAVFTGFIMAFLVSGHVDGPISFFLLGCTVLMIIGLLDDLITLSPHAKFGGQIIVAYSFIRAGLYLKESFFADRFIAIPFSFLWLLTCMNALNLVDVMDGLATTLSLVASLGFLAIAVLNGNFIVAQVIVLFMASLLAFLWFNRPPAKIYLGDAGSLFMGGFLGVIPFLLSWNDHVPWGFLLVPFSLALPLWEIIGLIIIRTAKGIPFYMGSKDHFCHYLYRKGWKTGDILAIVSVFGMLIIAIMLAAYQGYLTFIQTVCCMIFVIIGWIFLLCPRNRTSF